MNVTKGINASKEIKCCQPRIEGLLQMNSSESEKYAGVHDSLRITENNITNASESKEGLLEQILDRNNLNNGFKRVKSNKGAQGVDGIGVNCQFSN
jgi:RNA-directed DNA polymerase